MPRAEMEKIAAGVRGATLEVIGGAGHLPFLENPAAVAALLAAHIRKHS
jgi:pimeloyl-ACP methyl ester carboxylesterase